MSGPGGTPMDANSPLPEVTVQAAVAPASYLERLAEAERNVLSMSLRWLQDATVNDEDLANVIDVYADVLDEQEQGL